MHYTDMGRYMGPTTLLNHKKYGDMMFECCQCKISRPWEVMKKKTTGKYGINKSSPCLFCDKKNRSMKRVWKSPEVRRRELQSPVRREPSPVGRELSPVCRELNPEKKDSMEVEYYWL